MKPLILRYSSVFLGLSRPSASCFMRPNARHLSLEEPVMPDTKLRGVIAAVATPVNEDGSPDTFGSLIVGLKDSSGDMNYAREAAAISKSFDVFPSTEAVLLDARAGAFAGCISATANLNADLCQLAWAKGDKAAHDAAVTIRKLFDGKPLVSGVKALLAHIHGDPALARMKPPLAPFSAGDRAAAVAGYDQVRGKRVA